MRKVTMVRLGIAAAITCLGGLGALASGCTSDDNTGTATDGGTEDTGTNPTPDGGGTTDSGGKTDGGGVDSGPVIPDAKLILLHAAPGVGPVRLCIATATGTAAPSVAPINAIPDTHSSAPPWNPPPAYGPGYDGGVGAVVPGTPGLYPGTIAAVPDIASLTQFAITPFVIDANLIANNTADGGPDGGAELTCDQLIGKNGGGGVLPAGSFLQLPTVPAGTFADGTTWLLSATGCLPGFEPSTLGQGASITAQDICGASFDGGAPNVALSAVQLDTTTVAADGGWGVQFAQRSSAIEGTPFPIPEGETTHPAASAGLLPGFIESVTVTLDAGSDDAGDAGPTTITTQTFAPLGATPDTLAATSTALTPVVSVTANPATSLFAVVTLPGSGDGGAPVFTSYPISATGLGDVIALPLADVAQLSAWASSTLTAPTGFVSGQTYTFAFVGDNDFGVAQLTTPNPDGGSTPVQNPAYDGRGMHIVAFPNSFTAIPQQ